MLVAPGKLQAELECVYGTERITTTIFIIDVLPTNIDNDAIESSNEYSALTTLIAQAIADGVVEGWGLNKQATTTVQTVPNTSLCGSGITTVVAKESMNIRNQPSVNGSSIGIVYTGQAVDVLEKLSSGWMKIVWPGAAIGYAYTSNVSSKYYNFI